MISIECSYLSKDSKDISHQNMLDDIKFYLGNCMRKNRLKELQLSFLLEDKKIDIMLELKHIGTVDWHTNPKNILYLDK